MTYSAEPTMQDQLWTWLEDHGLDVYGEVSIKNGVIDLVCHDTEANQYIGIELKNSGGSPKRIEHPEMDERHDSSNLTDAMQSKIYATSYWPQLIKYATSKQLNKLYFACQDPARVIDLEEAGRKKLHTDHDEIPLGSKDIGQIRVPDPFSSDETIEILSESAEMERTDSPSLRRDDEQTVQHYIWEDIGGIREGVIPNRKKQTARRIDIMKFTDKQHPTDVYQKQADQDIIGVEVKGANAVRENPKSIQEQLSSYLDSGGITKLYFGVPEIVKNQASGLLDASNHNQLADVGLYTVNETGETIKQQSANKKPLYFDGIRENTNQRHTQVIDIGWGRSNPNIRVQSETDYYSVFDIS